MEQITDLNKEALSLIGSILDRHVGAVLKETVALAKHKKSKLKAPAIGSYWLDQGGIYAGMVRGEDGTPDYHLIVPTDPAGQVDKIKWGGAGKEEPSTTSHRDGKANTNALCNSHHEHPAAKWTFTLSIQGHSDWYLPARHELRLCFLNVPEQFDTDGWYWSSTQCSPYGAWVQDFVDGGQLGYGKDLALRARAVRRVVNP